MSELYKNAIIAQLRNLTHDEVIEIAQECNEILGLVSVSDYCNINMEKRRNVYYKIVRKKLKHIEISRQKFICINANI